MTGTPLKFDKIYIYIFKWKNSPLSWDHYRPLVDSHM